MTLASATPCALFLGIALSIAAPVSAQGISPSKDLLRVAKPGTPPTVALDTLPAGALLSGPVPLNPQHLPRALEREYAQVRVDSPLSALVQLRFHVMEDGRISPKSTHVVHSEDERLNQASIRAVQVLRFRPARLQDGTPVGAWVVFPIQWAIGSTDTPAPASGSPR